MNAKNFKLLLKLVLLSAFSLIAFQNCGRLGFNVAEDFLAENTGLASEECEGLLKQTYQNTYFPLLRANCNACHSNAHGSQNLDKSFQGFLSKGVSTIDYKATHPHGDNGVNLTNKIVALKPTWNAGQSQYMDCLASVDSGDSKNGGKLIVNGKVVTDLGTTATDGQQDAWKTVEWDLETEVPVSKMGRYKAFLKIEVRLSLNGNTIVGMDFRNPSLRLKKLEAGQNVQIDGLNIYIDNQMMPNVTTYTGVSMKVADTNYVNLAPGAGIALAFKPDVSADMKVAVEISHIQILEEEMPINP